MVSKMCLNINCKERHGDKIDLYIGKRKPLNRLRYFFKVHFSYKKLFFFFLLPFKSTSKRF